MGRQRALPHLEFGLLMVLWVRLAECHLAGDFKEYGSQQHWYSDIPEIVVLDPSMDLKELKARLLEVKTATTHFGPARRAVLLKPGVYPKDMAVNVGYYTTVSGVGRGPEWVTLDDVWVSNDITDQALNNFWRSLEGVTVTAGRTMWAVSQAAPLRRTIIKNELWLSHQTGYSSGGFMSDVEIHGKLVMGTQQQWYARQVLVPEEGLVCPGGWNFVFQDTVGLRPEEMEACNAGMVDKISKVSGIPRSAEKPYIVFEAGAEWKIYVPKVIENPPPGTVGKDRQSKIDRKLSIGENVFVATPQMSAAEINSAIIAKDGLLLTPGIYRLDMPLMVTSNGFVLLGIGFPTLVSPPGQSCLEVADFLADVRIAGILLDAATPVEAFFAQPLLQWGNRDRSHSRYADASTGVASDIFARVGTFGYLNCEIMRANTLLEFNSDNLIIDNVWVWHADHDDCSNFTMTPDNNKKEPMLSHKFKSDQCKSQHGVVVNGRNVVAFGIAVEHVVDGHLLVWNGEDGQLYFFQAELPYHSRLNLEKRYAAYVVSPHVKNHFAMGLGVYIIASEPAYAAIEVSAFTDIRKAITVAISGNSTLFQHQVCQVLPEGTRICHQPAHCQWARCYLAALPHADVELYTNGEVQPMSLPDVHLLPKPHIKEDLSEDVMERDAPVSFGDPSTQKKFALEDAQESGHLWSDVRLALVLGTPLVLAASVLLAIRSAFVRRWARVCHCDHEVWPREVLPILARDPA